MVHNATVLLLGRRRCLEKGTEILMYDGTIRKIENIKINDLVMGDDSTPRTVLDMHSGFDKLYKITNNRDEIYKVNSNHILSLIYTGKNKLRDRPTKNNYQITWFNKDTCKLNYKTFSYNIESKNDVYIKSKSFLDKIENDCKIDISIEDYLKLSKKHKNNLAGYQVSIEFSKKKLPLDPYILGYLLHDNITQNTLLDKYNLINDKHIPLDYKCNSRENRLKLLAGLIDADNYLEEKCDLVITQSIKHEKLIDDIIYLARSLGFSVTKHLKKISRVYNGEKKYEDVFRINISGKSIDKVPILIPHTGSLISKIKVEECDVGEYYGIELDGNHRFVLANFVVTHNSGKSYLVRDIFYHHKEIPLGLIFSGTEEANPFFGDFIPDSFIHSEYDPNLVGNMLTKQSQKVKKARTHGHADTDGLTPNNRAFIVLDDMLHDAAAWKKEKTIQSIFFNGRHYNLFFILTMQYPLGIPPALRSNIDYVFVFNEPSIKNRKKIYDDYAGMIASFDHFCNILDSCTTNHECLVIKTSGNSTDLREQIFWYKAAVFDKFRVGHPKIWEYHDAHYNAKYDEERDVEQENLDKLKQKFAKTKKLKIIVSRQGNIQEAIEESE